MRYTANRMSYLTYPNRYPQPQRPNALAMLFRWCALFGSHLLGIIFGHISLSQIKKTGRRPEAGRRGAGHHYLITVLTVVVVY